MPGTRQAPVGRAALGREPTRNEVGKVEVMSLYLPVVAMGSFPHIYQRAGLALGYPYSGCHVSWGNSSCFTILIFVRAELFQCQEPKFLAEVPHADPAVVVVVLSLLLHGP